MLPLCHFMQLADEIKQRIGRFFLSRDKAERVERSSLPFNRIQTIGVLYEANREDMELVKKYTSRLRQEGKKVFELGYYDQKELIFDINYTLHSEYIHRKHIKWNGLPVPDVATGFKNEPFDLLLNLYTNDSLPLFYVSLHSRARFRIGKFEKINMSFFDMMIDNGEDKDLGNLIKQIDYYIRKL
jgi:hypothetical protein